MNNSKKTVVEQKFLKTWFDTYCDVCVYEVTYSDGTKEIVEHRQDIGD